ncbi:hypothetical protein [Streptomyces lydicus]|uniref:hypothetical protein n=1 Tax=Streptomyces lydicus TaxID=47763 RepID=UPI0013E9090C|nr:hypothetical protein [Streptomyces lydicus]MCZ1011702.1 hypothetical protein [Streptomyces lydicus]
MAPRLRESARQLLGHDLRARREPPTEVPDELHAHRLRLRAVRHHQLTVLEVAFDGHTGE